MEKSIVRLQASVTINSEDWNSFLQMVTEVQSIVKLEGKENTLTHQTYQQSESFNCLIVEAYKNEQAFLQHLENIKYLSDKYKVDWKVNRLELSGPYSLATVNAMREGSRSIEFAFYENNIS
jgi:hypothetical protein